MGTALIGTRVFSIRRERLCPSYLLCSKRTHAKLRCESEMNWRQLQTRYPGTWVLVEAVEAHSDRGMRVLDDLSLLKVFGESTEAMQDYQRLHHQEPARELYVLHTDREQPNIEERRWLGIRGKG